MPQLRSSGSTAASVQGIRSIAPFAAAPSGDAIMATTGMANIMTNDPSQDAMVSAAGSDPTAALLSNPAMQLAAQALAGMQTRCTPTAASVAAAAAAAAAGLPPIPPLTIPGTSSMLLGHTPIVSLVQAEKAVSEAAEMQSLTLPEPTGLCLESSTTTSLHIKWNPVESLLVSPYAQSIVWHVEFCKADDTDVLGECEFPLAVSSAPVTALQADCEYKIRLRLQVKPPSPGAEPPMASAFTAAVFNTLNVKAVPHAPPKPVVHRVSSTLSEVSIMASPCQSSDGSYSCAESWQLQRLEGALPDDDSREEDWKSVPEVTCSCLHPKVSEIVPTLEKKRVPLMEGKIYHFRVRAINDRGNSKWSEIASIHPTPAACEVRVEYVRSLSSILVWSPPEGHGFEIQSYHVYMCKAEDDAELREAVVPTTTDAEDEDGNPIIRYHAQQLQPNCPYKFYVRAKSEAGLSDPSPACDVVTQPLPPPIPSGLTVDKIEPNSLHFSWTMKDATEVNFTSVCEVSWRLVTEEDEEACGGQLAKLPWLQDHEEREKWSSKEIPCLYEQGLEYKAKIIGLMSASTYAVQVRGRNTGGDGSWTPAVLQRTTVPPPPHPTTFYSADTTTTTTTLSWDQTFDDAYPVTAYQLRTFGPSENDVSGWVTIAAQEGAEDRVQYVAQDLQPGCEYAFQIRAVNQHGPGDESDKLKVTIKRDVPPPPGQPKSGLQTSNAIQLAWKPPIRDNGSEVTSYCLQMRPSGTMEWETVSDEITNLAVEVTCPLPKTMYVFRVRGQNALGYGPWSDEAMFETLAPPPPSPPQGLTAICNHDSVTISWLHYQSNVTGYEVQQLRNGSWVSLTEAAQVINDQLARLRRKRKHADIETTERDCVQKRSVLSYTKAHLLEQSEYQFRVVAKSPGGESASEPLHATTIGVEAAGSLTDADRAGLHKLCEETDCLEYEERFAAALYDRETLTRLPYEDLRLVFERMQVLPRHREKLRSALASPPGAPSKPTRVKVTADSVVLSWTPPEHDSAPIVDYVIELRVAHSGGEEQAALAVHSAASTCKVENLIASTEYVARVAAVNEIKGQGEWSPELTLHTSDATCQDPDLQAAMRRALNTCEYADKVASQLYHEQWTLKTLATLPAERLGAVLGRMRVKEGAVHSIIQQLSGA
jgi:hypothetical protein